MTVAPGVPVTPRGGFSAWLELTKPRIVLLVLFTGVPALLDRRVLNPDSAP